MRLEIEVSAQQLNKLEQLLAGKEEYQDIYSQLVSAVQILTTVNPTKHS